MITALIVVDFQHDFINGSLATHPPRSVIDTIVSAADHVDYVAYTRDWHPEDHFSFSSDPEFKDGSWPVHCVADTPGAEIDATLLGAVPADAIFSKGKLVNVEAYSGFDGVTDDGYTLDDWLDERGVGNVMIVGIATDYCVKATALSAADNGYHTVVLVDGVQGVTHNTSLVAASEMGDAGVRLAPLDEVVQLGF